ncbi:hypothetical protein PR202_gb27564 [Eleusine coracana subsp. coracana]|uniref:KIB1-4 beta-propeller domain-containing protein n=1 Tax=Eleusine coracana subsp. coracana TaxID=191504 RepID=A0AAV5FS67_ELECO|nr:hypothetical protein PR202_gb27564 [Eleusine coracana subsp. coracana]
MDLLSNAFPYSSLGTEELAVFRSFLVEYQGELLVVVKLRHDTMKVFKIDTVANVIEPVKDIGSRALFVGDCRCLSVDANCIYYVDDDGLVLTYDICIYSLKKDRPEVRIIGQAIDALDPFTIACSDPPFTVVQLLPLLPHLRGLQKLDLNWQAPATDDFWGLASMEPFSRMTKMRSTLAAVGAPDTLPIIHRVPEQEMDGRLHRHQHDKQSHGNGRLGVFSSGLIVRISDIFLATEDLDYYMDFYAICSSWRFATDDPRRIRVTRASALIGEMFLVVFDYEMVQMEVFKIIDTADKFASVDANCIYEQG